MKYSHNTAQCCSKQVKDRSSAKYGHTLESKLLALCEDGSTVLAEKIQKRYRDIRSAGNAHLAHQLADAAHLRATAGVVGVSTELTEEHFELKETLGEPSLQEQVRSHLNEGSSNKLLRFSL